MSPAATLGAYLALAGGLVMFLLLFVNDVPADYRGPVGPVAKAAPAMLACSAVLVVVGLALFVVG